MTHTRGMFIAAVLATVATAATAQDIAARVRSTGTGTLRFSYDVKAGVCGNGSTSVSWGNNNRTMTTGGGWTNSNNRKGESEVVCDPGPARVSLDIDRGKVTALRYYVGGRWNRSADGDDMGQVRAATAETYFESLIDNASDRVAKEAIVPAIIADGGDPYRTLLRAAKDRDRTNDMRKDAIFWLAQEAGEVATRDLRAIAVSEDDREIRKQAIFALSQQRNGAAVDALIDIVRTNRDGELRKSALFWLGQTNDAKALALIEELVLKR